MYRVLKQQSLLEAASNSGIIASRWGFWRLDGVVGCGNSGLEKKGVRTQECKEGDRKCISGNEGVGIGTQESKESCLRMAAERCSGLGEGRS